MRITKEGKIPKEKEYKAKCGNCNTEFAFYKKETNCPEFGGRYIKCPRCKKEISVRRSE